MNTRPLSHPSGDETLTKLWTWLMGRLGDRQEHTRDNLGRNLLRNDSTCFENVIIQCTRLVKFENLLNQKSSSPVPLSLCISMWVDYPLHVGFKKEGPQFKQNHSTTPIHFTLFYSSQIKFSSRPNEDDEGIWCTFASSLYPHSEIIAFHPHFSNHHQRVTD